MLATVGSGPARSTILILGAIAALGSLATQLLIPALPSIADELGIGIASSQLVIGVFLIGIGGGQLLVGPLADRIDRRTLLLAGLLLYAASSLVAALANSFLMLLAARLAQAIGSAAGVVTARVLLNSMVRPDQAVSAQASLMAIVLVSPAIAPVIGGLLTEFLGWRAIMLCLCGAGLIGTLVVARKISSSAVRSTPAVRTGPVNAYLRLLSNPQFLAATCALGFASATLYLFLGAAPFLLEREYGLSPRETGACLLLVACASIAGTRLVGRMRGRFDPLVLGTGMGLASSILLTALSAGSQPELPLMLCPLAALGFTAGLVGPAAISYIMASEPGIEGTATSLAGALQMTASAVFAWTLGPFATLGPFNLALSMIPLTAIAAIAALWLLHHRR